VSGNIRATTFVSTSDYRIKTNVQDLGPEFSVEHLHPVHYWNEKSGKNEIGFLAHEVQEKYPYLVVGEKDGEELQSLNYSGIIGILVKDLRECRQHIQQLQRMLLPNH
jgi:hypothetical protein